MQASTQSIIFPRYTSRHSTAYPVLSTHMWFECDLVKIEEFEWIPQRPNSLLVLEEQRRREKERRVFNRKEGSREEKHQYTLCSRCSKCNTSNWINRSTIDIFMYRKLESSIQSSQYIVYVDRSGLLGLLGRSWPVEGRVITLRPGILAISMFFNICLVSWSISMFSVSIADTSGT